MDEDELRGLEKMIANLKSMGERGMFEELEALIAEVRRLRPDAEAMALIKKHELSIETHGGEAGWYVYVNRASPACLNDLNEAISECVTGLRPEYAFACKSTGSFSASSK